MKLYGRRSSSNCQKVLWFLAELGLEYEFVAKGGDAGGLEEASYLTLNPNGKVPTWEDRNGAVWESHTILRYLAAEYGSARWWPRKPSARSQVDRWMDWSQSSLDEGFMRLFWAYWRTPERKRSEEAIARYLADCRSAVNTLDRVLSEQPYLAGRRFSLADVPAGSLIYRFTRLDITDDLPNAVSDWYERLTQRSSYRTHVMIPFDDLKGRLAF
ncbi:MAG: glutathione S-transferase family protein [Pseudomonadota bacterium]